MKRGDIWSISGAPGYGGKPRPAIIVQSDTLVGTQSVITCGLTSLVFENVPFRPLIEPSASNGLRVPSAAMVEKLTAVPRSKLGHYLGELSDEDMARVEQTMLMVQGFAG